MVCRFSIGTYHSQMRSTGTIVFEQRLPSAGTHGWQRKRCQQLGRISRTREKVNILPLAELKQWCMLESELFIWLFSFLLQPSVMMTLSLWNQVHCVKLTNEDSTRGITVQLPQSVKKKYNHLPEGLVGVRVRGLTNRWPWLDHKYSLLMSSKFHYLTHTMLGIVK